MTSLATAQNSTPLGFTTTLTSLGTNGTTIVQLALKNY